jgi:molybdopterin-guanine dinucleotide biosynthesis protein A
LPEGRLKTHFQKLKFNQMPHQKHPPIPRPTGDHYARTDLALVGSTCAVMDPLIEAWAVELNPNHRTLTVIGDHADPSPGALSQVGTKRFQTPSEHWNDFDERLQRTQYDLALVNGNHYPAARQVVFVDPAKAGTLERRREQLTDVLAVVLCPGAEALPDWLAEDLAGKEQPPVFKLEEATAGILPLLKTLLGTRVPALKTLLLTGGKSVRMGQRKADLVYRPDGRTEAQRLATIADKLLPGTVRISVADNAQPTVNDLPQLVDRFPGMGPAGAIATAFMHDPDAAWLVLACDLPLLEAAQLETLIGRRNPGKYGTAYRRASQPFPEPLIAIYEPKAYQRLLQFLALGYACPRKLLINSEIETLVAEDERPFTNANTPDEREQVLRTLSRT